MSDPKCPNCGKSLLECQGFCPKEDNIAIEKYRPSNGTEGLMFMEEFCERCIHDDMENRLFCPIIARTMAYEIDHPKYPAEWIREDGRPKCTKFKEA